MENTIKPVVHNRFDIEVADSKTGEIKQKTSSYNIVLDQFFTCLINRSSKMGYIHLGTGEGTPSPERKSMFQFLGAKGASVLDIVKQYPTSYIRKKIVLSPSEYVGARITEVGLGFSTSSTSAVTHSMLKDSEGNQIAIEKTDTDVLTIYSTFFVTIGEAVNGVYVLPEATNNEVISAVLQDTYSKISMIIGAHNTIETAEALSKKAILTKTNISPSADQANRKWQYPVTRLNYNEANSHVISSVGCPTIAAWILPNTNIFPQITLSNMAVGVGDGITTEFKCPIPKIVPNSEAVRVNGSLLKKGTDYIIDYENNAAEYPELFISSDGTNYAMSGGYQASYSRCGLVAWDAISKEPSIGLQAGNPLLFDFRKEITVNRFVIPKSSFTENFWSTGTPKAVISLEYSDDMDNWQTAHSTPSGGAYEIEADVWFDPPILARYWRLTSTQGSGFGAGMCPNIRFGRIVPGLTVADPPADGAAIEMDCKIDRPLKNENWVLDFSFAVQFERG